MDHNHVSKLVWDYWKYFAIFNKGRKKPTRQLIPNKVWLGVYEDYKEQSPDSSFKEDSLKDHLRDSLKYMKCGVNNPEEGDAAVIQDKDLMKKLMNTDSWKARNVLKLRSDLMSGKSKDFGPSNSTSPNTASRTSGGGVSDLGAQRVASPQAEKESIV